jgi:hypothetical protein
MTGRGEFVRTVARAVAGSIASLEWTDIDTHASALAKAWLTG